MANIVFFCIPAHGHTNPTLGVVQELTAMGLTVPVATQIAMKLRERGIDIPDAIYTTSYLSKLLLAKKEGNVC